jgi:PPM family protein phosphatase
MIMINPFIHSETNQRDKNEDSVCVFTLTTPSETIPITVLAIADGMGGHAYGEFISQEALKKLSLILFEQITLEPSLNPINPPPSITTDYLIQILTDSLQQTNAHIHRLVTNNHWGKGGTTLVVALIWQNQVIFGNLGDSPLFHYQAKTKQITKKTEDHTVTSVLLKEGLIIPELAPYHEGRNKLEFYAGCSHFPKDNPVYQLELANNDILLLCSDGISSKLSSAEITEIFQQNMGQLEQIGYNLIETAKNKEETDNQTLIIWQYQRNISAKSSKKQNKSSRKQKPKVTQKQTTTIKQTSLNY